MKISLIRHGRPTARQSSRIRAATFAAWLREYDEAGIDATLPPPDCLTRSLETCALIVTSPAKRAIQSADKLGAAAERRVSAEARETPLPARLVWPFSHRPATFVVIARILWLLGFARAEESKQQVGLRARLLAFQLCALARDFGHVALVGHGYMRVYLRKQLEAAGWRSSDSRAHGYWSCSHFEKEEPNSERPEANAGKASGATSALVPGVAHP